MASKSKKGGWSDALRKLVEEIGDLADTVSEVSRKGEALNGIYGFTIKVGLGDKPIKVEPFGNVKPREPVVEDVREPLVDVIEEKDHVLVVAEMPGIGAEDVRLEVRGRTLVLSAERGAKKYRKEIPLGGDFARDRMSVACKNGVVEIRCRR